MAATKQKASTSRKKAAAKPRPAAKLDYKLLGCSDAAVKKATKRVWPEWIAILDRFGVKKKGHAAASDHIYNEHGCPGWWSQMVVVGYERHRGLRRVREKADGFSASASRVVSATAAKVMDAFEDPKLASKWLPKGVKVHLVSRPKSARMTWTGGEKCLSVWMGEKKDKAGVAKTTVQVQHDKLPDAQMCNEMKRLWGERMEKLKGLVER